MDEMLKKSSDDEKIKQLYFVNDEWEKAEIICSLSNDDKKVELLDTIIDDEVKLKIIDSLVDGDKKTELFKEFNARILGDIDIPTMPDEMKIEDIEIPEMKIEDFKIPDIGEDLKINDFKIPDISDSINLEHEEIDDFKMPDVSEDLDEKYDESLGILEETEMVEVKNVVEVDKNSKKKKVTQEIQKEEVLDTMEERNIEDMSIEELKAESCRLATKIDDMEKEIRNQLMAMVKERRQRYVELDNQLEEIKNI